MRKLLAVLLLVSAALGQTKTTVTGVVQDASGNLATSGTVVFNLSPQNSGIIYFVTGTGIIAPQTGTCGIDGSGNIKNLALSGACQVWGTDLIQPANLTYQVAFFPNGVGSPTNTVAQQCITGATYDLSNPKFCPVIKPTPQGATVITSPIQNNLIPAADAVFNLGSASLRYGNIFSANGTFTNSIVAPNIPAGVVNSGAGTTNTIPKYTNGVTGALGNSSITDNGTTVSTSEVMAVLGLNINSTGLLSTTAQSGTGSLCMTTNCVMTIPNIGAAIGTSLSDSVGTPSTTGFLRLSSTDQTCFRNNANSADKCIAKTGAVGAIPADSLDVTQFGSLKVPEAIFTGPNPYYDPRVAGAKCDGATDDTSAFNTAISAANSGGGGQVLVPAGKTCVIAGQLNMAQMNGVRITAPTGIDTFNTPLPTLKFTGTTSPLIDARSSQGLEFDHFTVQYTNAAFAGRVLDFQRVTAQDSQNFRIHDMTITGTSTAKAAICLVCADNTDVGIVDKVSFFWALHAVEALNANIFQVSNSNFASANVGVGDITGAYITDLGNQSTIGPNNNFEMSTNTSAILCSTCGDGLNFLQNTFNDFVAGYNAILLNINSNAFNGIGNFVATGPGSTAIFLSVGAAVRGQFSGNTLGSWGICWNMPGSPTQLDIFANKYGTCTTFISLGANPTSGRIEDTNGHVANYGAQDIPEITAPSGAAGRSVIYADSTAHRLELSNNNGSFFPVTQTIGSATVTTAGTAVTNGTCQAQTGITITGSLTTDQAVANINAALPATWQTGIRWSAEVSAAGTCTVSLCNPTTASITPAATSVRCTVHR